MVKRGGGARINQISPALLPGKRMQNYYQLFIKRQMINSNVSSPLMMDDNKLRKVRKM